MISLGLNNCGNWAEQKTQSTVLLCTLLSFWYDFVSYRIILARVSYKMLNTINKNRHHIFLNISLRLSSLNISFWIFLSGFHHWIYYNVSDGLSFMLFVSLWNSLSGSGGMALQLRGLSKFMCHNCKKWNLAMVI